MAIKYEPQPLPQVQQIDFSVNSWQGLNLIKGSQSSGEMSAMKNMSSDNVPFSSPRRSRETVISGISNPQKLFDDENKLGYIANGRFIYDGVDKGECGDTNSVVVYDKRIFTFPSNKYYDTETGLFSASSSGLSVVNYGDNIKYYKFNSVNYYSSAAMFKLAENLDVSTLKTTLTFTTNTIVTNGLAFSFSANDIVKIEGCVLNPSNNKSDLTITAVSEDKKTLTFADGTFAAGEETGAVTITRINDSVKYITSTPNLTILTSGISPDYIYISAYNATGTDITVKSDLDFAAPYNTNFLLPENTASVMLYFLYTTHYWSFSRPTEDDIAQKNLDLAKFSLEIPTAKIWVSNTTYPQVGGVPAIDYACEYKNRIFAVEGSNIYASAQGDFADWTTFSDEEGNPDPTGAFATDVGSVGRFNGIVNYKGYVVATKPDMVYEIYGDKPPFTVTELVKTGCIDGRSICEVNSVLYWLGRQGVYAYTGGQPRVISEKLNITLTQGVAGADGRKYYLSAYDGTEWNLYVYDTFTGYWHIEDGIEVKDFTFYDGHLLALTADGTLLKFNSGTEFVNWEFETQDYTFNTQATKNISKLYIRVEMKPLTTLDVYLKSNNSEYSRVAYYTKDEYSMFDFKVRVKKCDSFSLKFAGRGDVRILDIHGKVTVGTSKHRSGNNLHVFRG